MRWCIFHEEEDPQYHNMQDMYGDAAYKVCNRETTEQRLRSAIEESISTKELPKCYREAEIIWEEEPKKHELYL
jgi:hypothetical protein